MEIEEPHQGRGGCRKYKYNRLCVLACIGGSVVVTIVYVCLHKSGNSNIKLRVHSHGDDRTGRVNIWMGQKFPYNVTVTSDLDVIQSYGDGTSDGTKVEISVTDLMRNRTDRPVRMYRSGKYYDVKISYEERRPIGARKYRLTDLEEIKTGPQNIFFIESRCGTAREMSRRSADDGVVFNARQTCAVESTARTNPNHSIYILHTCPLDDDFYVKSPRYVQELVATYPNVHVVQLNMSEFFIRTNVEELYFGGKFEASKHPIEHVSDVMRLLTLWRYAGTYMDIDVVTIRPIDELGTNYAGWQDGNTIATGVLNFDEAGFGHQVLTNCLEELKKNFDPDNWSTNGPILVTNILMRLCQIRPGKSCQHFTAYPVPVFYPFYYTEWSLFFKEAYTDFVLNNLNDTYVVHLWNKMSRDCAVDVGSRQAYALLAQRYCPKAYFNCGAQF